MSRDSDKLARRRVLEGMLLAPVAGSLMISGAIAQPAPKKLLLPEFLDSAELQIENAGQRKEMSRALADLERLPIAKLRETRYADYQGQTGKWTSRRILAAYFYSPKPLPKADEDFYAELGYEEVKTRLRAFNSLVMPKLQEK